MTAIASLAHSFIDRTDQQNYIVQPCSRGRLRPTASFSTISRPLCTENLSFQSYIPLRI